MDRLSPAETDRLLAAVEQDDVDTVRSFLASGFPPDGTLRPDDLSEPFTLCESASARGSLAVLRCLLEAGAGVNRGRSLKPLNAACSANQPEAARLLLAAGADPNAAASRGPEGDRGWTPLLFAVTTGNREMATRLLDAGADPARVTRKGITALGLAAERADLDLVRRLLATGAPVPQTVLIDPVRAGQAALVQLLVAAGADVNAVAPAGHEWVPNLAPLEIAILHRNQMRAGAALRGLVRQYFAGAEERPEEDVAERRRDYLAILETLLDAGADLNRVTHARSPVYTAVSLNDLEALRRLLARGADPNSGLNSPARGRGGAAPGPQYHTALHAAAEAGFEEAARLLLAAGADADRTDFAGRTPLEVAERKGQQRLVELLRTSAAT